MGNEVKGGLAKEDEVADFLGVAVATLRKWRHFGSGPRFIKIGGTAVRYSWDNVQEWICAQSTGGGVREQPPAKRKASKPVGQPKTTIPPLQETAVCSICGTQYEPERHPSPGRNNYCQACRQSPTAWRLAKRQERQRKTAQ